MRVPGSRTNLAKVSCILSGVTVLVGLVSLFSNHWVESETMHVGFISGCFDGFCSSPLDNMPNEYRPAYVVGVTMLVFMPLALIFVSAVLQGITVLKGPSNRRDVSGLVLAWLSGYHSLLLTILLIAAASMMPSPPDTDTRSQFGSYWSTTHTIVNGEHVVVESGFDSEEQYDLPSRVGWSAYVGLFAAVLSLASAVSSSLYFGKADNEQSHDVIPLQTNKI